MRFPKLHNDNKETKKLSLDKLSESWKDIKEMLHY